MVWVKATRDDYNAVGVEIDSEVGIGGKCIKHVTHFTAEQLNSMRLDPVKYEFVDDPVTQ